LADQLTIATTTHGRVLVEDTAVASSSRLIVAFHGYAQRAEDVLAEVQRIPGVSQWRVAAVQALDRFYGRDQQTVVASWMTRQDRELAIADNIEYVDRVVDTLASSTAPDPLVFLGFSQGASMAYRAALLGRHRAHGVIALGGDVPPELRERRAEMGEWPPVLVGAGHLDQWYTADKLKADLSFFEAHRVSYELCRIAGGHEWTEEFRVAAGDWLAAIR
jgi:predicted esterase